MATWREMADIDIQAHDAPAPACAKQPLGTGTLQGLVFRAECPTCHGAGAIPTAQFAMCCPTCNHTGWLDVTVSVAELKKVLEEAG